MRKCAGGWPSVQAVEICGLDVPVEDVRAVHTVQCLVEILNAYARIEDFQTAVGELPELVSSTGAGRLGLAAL